jgi:monofunctional biosynthetic peptidoglycan transglycosylase
MAIVGLLFRKILTFMKWFFIISIVSVILFRFIPIPITPTMLYLLGEQAFDSERKIVLKKDWESLSNISPNMKLAVIAAEDQLFYEHYGFDFAAIKKAIRNNEKGKRLKGGSTISQQTAKNAFLLPHRSYIRKGLEAYFTMLIELLWSKDRIMEVYLNVIEFGNGVYGVEAAAQHFFKKPASKLSKDEAALLAAVLPNPIRFRVDNPSSYVQRRKNWIKRQIGRMGLPVKN